MNRIQICFCTMAHNEKYIFCLDILAVDWYNTYQNCMLKTSDFLNKILLPREIHIYKTEKHSHRLKLKEWRGETEVSFSLSTNGQQTSYPTPQDFIQACANCQSPRWLGTVQFITFVTIFLAKKANKSRGTTLCCFTDSQ